MYSLKDQHIDFILNDISARGVKTEDLQYNLLDHICCIIENELEENGNFEHFYRQIISRFYKKELKELEEETQLLLTFKHYYTMKKAMIYGGMFSLAFIAIGTLFKIQHWPGASIGLLIGFVTLSFIFFPSAVYLNYNNESKKKKPVLNFSLLLGGISLIAGILFKTMHWPGAGFLLIAGWTLLLAVFLPALLLSKLKETDSSNEKAMYVLGAVALLLFEGATMFKIFHWPGAGPQMILGSVLLVGIFIPMYTKMKLAKKEMTAGQFVFVITLSMYALVLTSLLAMNVSGNVIDRFKKDEANSSKLLGYFEKKRERLMNEIENDSARSDLKGKYLAVDKAAENIRQLIFSIKCRLIENVEGVNNATAKNLAANTRGITRADNYDVVNQTLLIAEKENALRLKQEIEKFRETAIKASGNDATLSRRISTLLETGAGQDQSWEEKNFRNNLLITALDRLNDIAKNVSIVESEIILNTK